jgi:hypothetical protein
MTAERCAERTAERDAEGCLSVSHPSPSPSLLMLTKVAVTIYGVLRVFLSDGAQVKS